MERIIKQYKLNLYGLIRVLSNPFHTVLSICNTFRRIIRGDKLEQVSFKLIFLPFFYNQVELCKISHTFYKIYSTISHVFPPIDFAAATVLSV